MGYADNELRGMIPAELEERKRKASKRHLHPGVKGDAGGFPINPSATADSLARALEQQANNFLPDKPQGNPQANALASLQQQLFERMNDIYVPPTPLEELRKMAHQQVDAQFDPVIEALQNQMSTHENRAHESQDTARDMYGGLSKDMIAQIPLLTERFNAMDQATNQRYDQAQEMMQGQYQQQSENQNAILRRLGIQAAAQPASQTAMDDQSYFQNAMELAQNQQLNSLDQQQNAATTYQRSLGSNAKFAGQNRVNEIGNALEDYLTQAEGQMTGLQNQKSQALAALLAKMQQQDAQRVAQQTQTQRDNLMDLFRFQLDATKAMDSMGGNDQLFKGTTGLSGASNYLAQQYPNSPILSQDLMEHIQEVLQNPDVVNGKFVLTPGDPSLGKEPTYSDVGQEYMMKLLRDTFADDQGQYSTQNINDAVNALLAYMGKLR